MMKCFWGILFRRFTIGYQILTLLKWIWRFTLTFLVWLPYNCFLNTWIFYLFIYLCVYDPPLNTFTAIWHYYRPSFKDLKTTLCFIVALDNPMVESITIRDWLNLKIELNWIQCKMKFNSDFKVESTSNLYWFNCKT